MKPMRLLTCVWMSAAVVAASLLPTLLRADDAPVGIDPTAMAPAADAPAPVAPAPVAPVAIAPAVTAPPAMAVAPAGELVQTLSIPASLVGKDEAIRRAVAAAAGSLTWIVVSQQEGEIVLRLNHRGVEATLTCVVKDSLLPIYAEVYKVDKIGTHKSRMAMVPRWLVHLSKAINQQFGR